MHKYLCVIFAAATLLFISCSSEEKINKSEIQQLVVDALSGDTEANSKLHSLIDSEHIGKTDYNQLYIDSLTANNKYYFSVLLEYFNPTFNLFAIYDSDFNLYLIDKSLNGYLNSTWTLIDNRIFVFVQEKFLTKDVLSIERFSIYEVFDNSAVLVYRALSHFENDKINSSQTVGSISESYILTKMSSKTDNTINDRVDTFYFNAESKNYISKSNLFNNYVKQQIEGFSWTIVKPEIPAGFLDSKTN